MTVRAEWIRHTLPLGCAEMPHLVGHEPNRDFPQGSNCWSSNLHKHCRNYHNNFDVSMLTIESLPLEIIHLITSQLTIKEYYNFHNANKQLHLLRHPCNFKIESYRLEWFLKKAPTSVLDGYIWKVDARLCETHNTRLLFKKGASVCERLLGNDMISVQQFGELLLESASNKHFHLCRQLLQKGANINHCNYYRSTVLHYACLEGDIDFVRDLIQLGADLTIRSTQSGNVLECAAKNGNVEMFRFLLDMGAPFTKDTDAPIYFYNSCLAGHLELCKYLVSIGCKVNSKTIATSPMVACCKGGSEQVFRFLLEQGAKLQVKGKTNLLYHAAGSGSVEICKILIEEGLNVNQAAAKGITPLLNACQNGHEDVFFLLIENSAELTREQVSSHFLTATNSGSVRICRYFIEKGVNVNQHYKNNDTTLHLMAEHGHAEICKMLIELGANVNATNSGYETPLHSAARNGRLEACQVLLENGVNVNAKSMYDVTALYRAAKENRFNICKLLLEHGADPKISINMGWTPLHRASENGNLALCKLLVAHGADPKQTTNKGQRPFGLLRGKYPELREYFKSLTAAKKPDKKRKKKKAETESEEESDEE
ncbi:ankyrin repeat-containing domain protein [Gorgonomyces haynaldii]|nr:ankyrin repeat-containing domain protein [Gorgonomyces haynaldii]